MFTTHNSMDYSNSMKKRSFVYNVLFGLGILFIVAGIFLTLQFSKSISVTAQNVGMVLFWLLLGVYCLYHEFTHEKNVFGLFTGFFSLVIGIVVMVSGAGSPLFTFKQLWPVLVIGFGICFFSAGLISRRKFYAFFTIPSVILILLGIVFLLFSFDIITVSFTQFAARWWPVLLIIAGLALVIVFYRRQHFAAVSDFHFEEEDEQLDYDGYDSF